MKIRLLIVSLLLACTPMFSQPTSYPASAGAGGNASNSYYGAQAGVNNTANGNTFVGEASGFSNTTGIGNTFLGWSTGFNNQTSFNTFVGHSTGLSNTTGGWNTFIGASSGAVNTSGSDNVFIGQVSGSANTTGSYNTYVGRTSGAQSTTGQYNVFIGHSSGHYNNTGENSFVGVASGSATTISGGLNSFFGAYTGVANTSGIYNTFIGHSAGRENASGESLTFLGADAGRLSTGGFNNTFLGYASGRSNNGTANLFVGSTSGFFNTTGNNNTFLGNGTGAGNANGSGNVFLGNGAGALEMGSNLLYIANSNTNDPLIWGDFNLPTLNFNGTVGIDLNRAAGELPSATLDVNGNARIRSINQNDALTHVVVADSDGNIFWREGGAIADNLGNHTATMNVTADADGVHSIGSALSSFHDLFLDGSIFFNDEQFIDNANGNIAIGHASLDAVTAGTQNVSIGENTLPNTTTGSGNVAVGFGALGTNTSGNNNTAVGTNSGPFVLMGGNLTNTTAIGNGARTVSSNQVRLGNSSVTSIGGYAAWSVVSDGRFKKNVREDVGGLSFIEKLRPVSYELEEQKLRRFLGEEEVRNPARQRQVGFIAQEVEEAVSESGIVFSGVEKPGSDAEHYSLQYSQFVVPLTKAVQELSAMVKDQQKQIASLEKLLSEADFKNTTSASVALREGFTLEQNHPNPFNTTTTINVTLPDAVKNAIIVIHDLRGTELKRITINGRGNTTVTLEANELNAGMYLYSLVADGELIDTKRMLLMN